MMAVRLSLKKAQIELNLDFAENMNFDLCPLPPELLILETWSDSLFNATGNDTRNIGFD